MNHGTFRCVSRQELDAFDHVAPTLDVLKDLVGELLHLREHRTELQEHLSAIREGYTCQKEGVGLAQNPYSIDEKRMLHERWVLGWHAAAGAAWAKGLSPREAAAPPPVEDQSKANLLARAEKAEKELADLRTWMTSTKTTIDGAIPTMPVSVPSLPVVVPQDPEISRELDEMVRNFGGLSTYVRSTFPGEQGPTVAETVGRLLRELLVFRAVERGRAQDMSELRKTAKLAEDADGVEVREGPPGTWTLRSLADRNRMVQIMTPSFGDPQISIIADRMPSLTQAEWIALFRKGCAARGWVDPYNAVLVADGARAVRPGV